MDNYMDNKPKWNISEAEKKVLIKALTDELYTLRAKAGIAQDELAKIIGVSRQTYGAIERKSRKMSWGTYLSLLFFFDYNNTTRYILRKTPAFPNDFIERINGVQVDFENDKNQSMISMFSALDDQAVHTIETVLMLEYARCTNTPGEVIVKSFDGRNYTRDVMGINSAIKKAIKNIKEHNSKE